LAFVTGCCAETIAELNSRKIKISFLIQLVLAAFWRDNKVKGNEGSEIIFLPVVKF
jgi:hypothetical protein